MQITYFLDTRTGDSIVAQIGDQQVWAFECRYGKARDIGMSEETGLIEINGTYYGTGWQDADPLIDAYEEITFPNSAISQELMLALGAAIQMHLAPIKD